MEEESGGWTRLGVVYSALGTSMIPHQTFQNQWMQEYGAVYCIFCINHQDNTALLWLKMKWIWIFLKSRQFWERIVWAGVLHVLIVFAGIDPVFLILYLAAGRRGFYNQYLHYYHLLGTCHAVAGAVWVDMVI